MTLFEKAPLLTSLELVTPNDLAHAFSLSELCCSVFVLPSIIESLLPFAAFSITWFTLTALLLLLLLLPLLLLVEIAAFTATVALLTLSMLNVRLGLVLFAISIFMRSLLPEMSQLLLSSDSSSLSTLFLFENLAFTVLSRIDKISFGSFGPDSSLEPSEGPLDDPAGLCEGRLGSLSLSLSALSAAAGEVRDSPGSVSPSELDSLGPDSSTPVFGLMRICLLFSIEGIVPDAPMAAGEVEADAGGGGGNMDPFRVFAVGDVEDEEALFG